MPTLWVYAANDHAFPPAQAHAFFRAFVGAGGRGTLVEAPAFGDEGHSLFSGRGRAVWTPIVDHWLAARGLAPRGETVAAPALRPPSGLGAAAAGDFRAFLEAPGHKAFAIGPAGGYAWRTAGPTVKDAGARALRHCAELAKAACRLHAADDADAP